MRGGTWLLAGTVAAVWLAVYVVTQLVPRPPLPTGWTLLVGVVLSSIVILGYPSALRGPRQGRRPAARGDGRPGETIALVSRGMPLRSGLTPEAAERTVALLRPMLAADAVAITDREQVLAFTGPGADHHGRGAPLMTATTRRVLEGARTQVVRHRDDLGCPVPDCPLTTATVAPLRLGDRVVGALKVFRMDVSPPPRDLVEGMAGILSLHLELAELDRERQLAAAAKLDALRAQINPHFLFNTLNTITSKARTDPEEARQLLVRLSDFFRYSIRQHGHFAGFGQEYFFVRTYLALEQARFGDALRVHYDVDPQVLAVQVPVLTIQPLVENAVRHGLAPKVGGGTVTLRARVDPLLRTTEISVRDDGVGMPQEVLEKVLHNGNDASHGGIGLRNISERLATLFGERYGMDIHSRPGEGTTVELRLPLR